MKVKFNRAAFQEALNLVTSIIPARTPKEILRCLRITAERDAVRLCATDLEVGINYRVTQVDVEAEGDFVVPADKIASIIRESIDEVVVMEAAEATVHIKGADSHFTIYGHDPGQFPHVPGFEGDADLEITLGKLQESIEYSLFSAARESTRYALNGVLWEVNGKKLILVATDGRRLAKVVASLQSAGGSLPDGRVIVPAKTMGLLDRIGGDESALVAIRFVDNQIVLACEQVVISSNLVEGNFPKYEDIIPKDYDKKLSLKTDAALSAVRRAALLANEDSKGIRISLNEGTMVFSSRAPETGDAQIDMAIDYKGAPIEVGFNPQFLIDVLRVIKSDIFELQLGEPDRPGMIKSGKDFLYIVMPVNL
ncbi:MAG: DNA polymerase III subunit beta [Sedimentisphaerales bacterium]|nr:DNA polymerase III subunit beta [Sedimentisphaerales bacterium]